MNNEVFVDASAWIAVSDLRDKYHQSAKIAYTRLFTEQRILVTTNLVIAETYILVRRAVGHNQAIKFIQGLRGSPRLRKVYSDERLEWLAEQLLESRRDHDLSLTDAVSFIVMQERQIETAFTFDHHFAAQGFQMWPVQIKYGG